MTSVAIDGLKDFFDDRMKRIQGTIEDMPTVAEIGRITLVLHGLEEAINEVQISNQENHVEALDSIRQNRDMYKDLLQRVQRLEKIKSSAKSILIWLLSAGFVITIAIIL